MVTCTLCRDINLSLCPAAITDLTGIIFTTRLIPSIAQLRHRDGLHRRIQISTISIQMIDDPCFRDIHHRILLLHIADTLRYIISRPGPAVIPLAHGKSLESHDYCKRLHLIRNLLDFLWEHLPEPLRPLVEKAQQLIPVPDVQEPKREHDRGHSLDGMSL